MTCFWDGIFHSLDNKDFEILQIKKTNIHNFIKLLKEKNVLAKDVFWQGEKLKEQELSEHYEAIKSYDITKINNGHLTSTCDSFLLLLCHLLKINIKNIYLVTEINYTINNSRKLLCFKNNKGHFQSC